MLLKSRLARAVAKLFVVALPRVPREPRVKPVQGAAIVSRVKDPGTMAGRGRGVAVVGAGVAPNSALTVYSLCVR